MRLVCTFDNEKEARTFSAFLTNEQIENQLEVFANTDWGSDDYGTVLCKIWVVDEDQVEGALYWYEYFKANPNDPRLTEKPVPVEEPVKKVVEFPTAPTKTRPIGIITLYTLVSCAIIFLFGQFTTRPYEKPPANLPYTPLFSSPINKALYYDYPLAYVLIDQVIKTYGFESLNTPQTLPPEGQYLLQQSQRTPIWSGLYDKAVVRLRDGVTPTYFDAPMFEKIREGEVWRLFSPCILHNDIIHLLFNMLWLIVLGKQMEEKLGAIRYLTFFLVAGVISNTAQYLMSGANFIGFSGILCGMILFVWIRQKKAPWEGYQLLPMTMGFITVFILAMFGIQLVSFLMEINGMNPLVPGIANTAHLSGAFVGYLFAQSDKFAWKK